MINGLKLYRHKRFVAFLGIVMSLIGQHAFAELSENQLKHYDHQLFTAPDTAYKALTFSTPSEDWNESRRIWLLLRIAQAENLLSLYREMDSTLATLQSYKAKMAVRQQAMLAYLEGVSAHKHGDLKTSIGRLTLSTELTEETRSDIIYALAVRELGYVYALSGDYYQANYILHQAYKSIVPMDNAFFNGLIEESLGDTYNYSGNYAKSLEYYKGALNYFRQQGYPSFTASTLLGLAIVNRRLGNWDQALQLFDQYESALSFSENFSQMFYLHYGRAMTLAEKGDCAVAVNAIDKALSLTGPKDYFAELFKKRALCHIQQDDISQARTDLSQARNILDSMEELQGTQWYLELRYIEGLLALKENRSETAVSLINSYYQEYLALQERNNSERIASMMATMEAERKDQEIAFLKNESQLQRAESKAQNLLVQQHRLLLIGAVVISLLLTAFLLFQYKNSKRLLALSIRDELTGLHNRRYVFDYFETVIGNERTSPTQISLVLFDIDDFKQINDNWGHQIGDKVIQEVSGIAAEHLRSSDIISRIGGDEFLIILPRTSLEQATDIAHRFIDKVAAHPFPVPDGMDLRLTASVGIAHTDRRPASRKDVEKLIESADKALYASKRNGKNTYTIADVTREIAMSAT